MRELLVVEIRKNLRFLKKENLVSLIIEELVKPLGNNDLHGFADKLYDGLIEMWEADEIA
jgi:hypothetical protein